MQSQAKTEDSRFDTERRLIGKGSALVRFQYLNWNEYIKRNEAKRQPDKEHVERLKRVFHKVGWRRLEILHHIPAIVSQEQLDSALKEARRKGIWKSDALPDNYATINNQDGYPELEFPGGIECLHGIHRVQAGKECLRSDEKWWIVDLYLAGISYELSTILNEEYSNKENPCDGEIYRKIREYQFLPSKGSCHISPATCVSFEMLWWSRLHISREKKLRRLLNCRQHRNFAASFDALTRIPALFDAGMRVTTLNKVMGTKCYEELCHYNTEYIFEAWTGFLKGVENGFQRIDRSTVSTLELRAPGVSTSDARDLEPKVLGGRIFEAFDRHERAVIWKNIYAYRSMIPSLSKFFQDVHLLQACVDSIRWLIRAPPDQSIFRALEDAYIQRDSQIIQTSATTCRYETGTRSYCLKLAYLGLFAKAAQNYRDLPKAPSGDILREMPRAQVDRAILQKFASFAYQLGFSTPEIEKHRGDSLPLSPTIPLEPFPDIVTTGPGEDVKWRWGLPRTYTFKRDKDSLYLDNLYRENNEIGEGITSFFVLKSWFVAFFGPWPRKTLSFDHQSPPQPGAEEGNLSRHEEGVSMMEDNPRQEQEQPQNMDLDEEIAARPGESGMEAIATQEEETLFVPLETPPDVRQIYFVEKKSADTIKPFTSAPRQHGQSIQVEDGDPKSLVAQHVRHYLEEGWRTYVAGKIFQPEEYYAMAIQNDDTLYLIRETPRASYVEHEISQEGNSRDVSQGVEDVLEPEENNASNSYILDSSNITINLQRREGNSNENFQPALGYKYKLLRSVDVPLGGPQQQLKDILDTLWTKCHLMPYDKDLRALALEDCYTAARKDDDHNIYFMPPTPQSEDQKQAERDFIPRPLTPEFIESLNHNSESESQKAVRAPIAEHIERRKPRNKKLIKGPKKSSASDFPKREGGIVEAGPDEHRRKIAKVGERGESRGLGLVRTWPEIVVRNKDRPIMREQPDEEESDGIK